MTACCQMTTNGDLDRLTSPQVFTMVPQYTDGTVLNLNEVAYTSICVQTTSLQSSILSQTRQNVVLASDLNNISESNAYDITINAPNYEAERIYFLNVPQEVVRRTRNATTNHYQSVGSSGRITNNYRSPSTQRPIRQDDMRRLPWTRYILILPLSPVVLLVHKCMLGIHHAISRLWDAF